jgi:hypothetical protein
MSLDTLMFLFPLLSIMIPCAAVLIISIALRRAYLAFRAQGLIKAIYRYPNDEKVMGFVRIVRRIRFPQGMFEWNQLRNLFDVVNASKDVKLRTKEELYRELSRLGVHLGNRQPHDPEDESIKAAGEAGERDTAHQLQFLPAGYKVFNGIYLTAGGQTQEFDHIVIGENGIFHIDSKNFAGELRFTENGFEQNGVPAPDPTSQLHRHEFVIRALLREIGIDTDVVGIICFTNERANLIGQSPDFVTLKLSRLLSFIKGYEAKSPISSDDVERVWRAMSLNSRPSETYKHA